MSTRDWSAQVVIRPDARLGMIWFKPRWQPIRDCGSVWLYSLERNFQQELANIQADFLSEKEIMLSKFYKEKRELSAIIDAIENEEEGRNSDVSLPSSL